MLVSAAEARLGETHKEIFQRYGKVLRREDAGGTNEWHGFYEFKGYSIKVSFSNNVSMAEYVLTGEKREMTTVELEKLVKLIGGEDGWEKLPFLNEWRNLLYRSMADCIKVDGRHCLRVARTDYINAERGSNQQAGQKAIEKRTGGF